MAFVILVFGGLAVAAITLLALGHGYYFAPAAERVYSETHQRFGPAGSLGLTLGAVATALFLSNFAYQLRKGVRLMARAGSLANWMTWHVFAGLVGGGLAALHGVFEARNSLTKACAYSLIVVVITGVIGRFFLRFVPRNASGQRIDAQALQDELMRLVDSLRPQVVHDPRAIEALQQIVDSVEVDPAEEVTISLGDIRRRLARTKGAMRALGASLRRGDASSELDRLSREMTRLSRQAALAHISGRVLDNWRAFHRAFALLLLVAMLIHVGVALYFGYI